jgi:hypothetical protein
MAVNIVSKITVKGVCGKMDLEKLLAAPGKTIELMDVYGLARKAIPDSSDYGEYVKFRGSFKAINLEDGEIVQSGACILPKVAQEALAGQFTDDTQEVAFGFRVSAAYDPEAVTKYVYKVIPLMVPAENDALGLLENKIKNDFKKLQAPGSLPAPKGAASAADKAKQGEKVLA